MTETGDEKECRICRGDAETERPLFHPCKCSGSIKYTHEDCLIKWLAESGSTQCELCHHPFRFEPLYEPDTPHLLPTREFLVGILSRVRRAIKTAARISLVFVVWLFLLPIATCWTWYSLFLRSPVHLPLLVISRGISGLITDAFRGCLLSVGIVFVFLGVSSLREYARHIPDDDLDHETEDAFDIPDDAEEAGLGMLDARNLNANELPPPHWPAGEEPEDHVHHDLPYGDADDEEEQVIEEWDDFLRDTMAIAHDDDAEDNHELPALHDNLLMPGARMEGRRPGQAGDVPLNEEQGLAGLLEIVGDLAEGGSDSESLDDVESDVASVDTFPDLQQGLADLDMMVEEANNARGGGGALLDLFELDPDEVPLEEVVGLRGHLRNLFDNAGTVLVSNALFLGIFTFIPLCIGRLTLRLLSFRTFPIPKSLGFESLIPSSSTANSSVTGLAKGIASDVGLSFGSLNYSWHGHMSIGSNVARFVSVSHAEFRQALADIQSSNDNEPLVSYADNLLVVLLGYGVVSLCAISYVIANSVLRSRYPRLDSPMTRYVAGMLRYVATIVKILVLILFEFGIFPLGCGWWLDICTLDLVGGTLESRISFCRVVPWLCTAGHWLLGIVFMVQISLFVSLLREVLRPELLWFLRNPDDPDFHPFRELVEKPLSRHARRMCLSVFIYVPLVVATVYVPSKLCMYFLPKVFPLRFDDFSHSLVDVPFGNLLVVPLVSLMHHTRPGLILRKVLEFWIDHVGSALGILHLVAKQPEDEDENVGDAPAEGLEGEAEAREALLRMPDEVGRAGHHQWTEPELSDSEYWVDDAETEANDVRWRATTMILLAWATLVICECFFLAAPTVLGRNLMKLVGLPVYHDLHSFGTGCYILLMSVQLLTHLKSFLTNVDTATLLRTALPRIQMAVNGFLLVVLWLGAIPLAAGILLELTITVPLRVPYNETPYLYLQQDWALGLLIMKLWNKVALAGRLNIEWRERVERAREGGFLGVGPNISRTLNEVVLPVLGWTMLALSAPYAFAYGFLPMLGCSAFAAGVAYRFSYLGVAMTYLLQLTMRSLYSAMRALHDSIRDDKYLIGKRLHNFRNDR